MASGSVRPAAPLVEKSISADKLIDTQLGRVRRHIRITDLIAGLMVLFAGVFAFLILVAVVDHWIVGLGVAGRFLVLVTLIAGAGWHLAINVVPLMLRRINPAYAAQTIERGEPTLKNSLLNYLLLRRESTGMHAVVYQAVQQRAAADVARIEVDQTVDRSALIRAGYVLAGIMAVAAAYKILSPKDPFQTVRRIASPWSDIARPARVTIDAVEPGNADVIQGQTVDIAALVRGARATEVVKLIYSSVDGQVVDQAVTMKPDSTGLRHLGQLPPGGSGIQQDFVYRVSAGDAMTPEYRLRAVPAPTMTVETVEYDFPAYTQRAREVVERQGDLKAVEGTRVTVRARANQSIRIATIEMTPSQVSGAAKDKNHRIPMQFRDTDAWHSWTLELAADRQSPKYSAYLATFTNAAGLTNRDPATHRIEVVPDLPPEVEILTPNKETVQVPVSGEQRIEVRAIDPDYGLSGVRLKAVCAGREILDQPLLENSIGQAGQVVVEFKFRPRDLQLSAGSQVNYWGVAIDNRHSESTPQPNTIHTPHRTLVIVDDPQAQPAKQGENATDKTATPADDGQPMPPATKPTPRDKPQPSDPNDKPDPDQKQPSDQKQPGDQKQAGDKGSQDKQPSSGQPDSSQQSGKQSSDQQGGSSGKGQSQSGEGQQGKQQGGGSSKSNQPSTSQPGQGTNGQEAGGNPAQQTKPSNKETTPGKDPNADGAVHEGGQSGQRSEPLHDGEVFEKALDRLKQKDQKGNSDQRSPADPNANDQREDQGSDTKQGDATGTDASKTEPQGSPNEKTSNKSPTKQPSAGADPSDQNKKSADKRGNPIDQGEPQPQSNQDRTQAGEQPADAKEKGSAEKGSAKKGSENKGSGSAAKEKEKEKGSPKQEGLSKSGEQAKPGTEKQPGAGDQGKSGAGQKDDEKTGSDKKSTQGDRHKTQQPDNATSPPGDPPPPNESERPSDTKGQDSGDRSGAGKKGAGQGANQPGKDSSGSNTPSDEGAGAAKEPGTGEKSSSPGKQQPSPTPNGSSGNEKGPGSQSKSDSQGKQPAPQSTPDSSAPPANRDKSQQPASGKPDASGNAPANQGNPSGGGQAADRPVGTPGANAEVAAGDDANLDYSRRATDLVLEYLKDQKDKPDEQLLDDLGWTAEDLRGFLERWQKLKQTAAEDPTARRELDETLRGLGLRSQADTKRTGSARSDDVRGLRESGIKSTPPSAYQEQFNAFKKGAARSPAK